LGEILQNLGRPDEARASYLQAITLNPTYAEAHNNLGNALLSLGRLDDAEASYLRALQINPNYAEAHYNLGIVLRDLGRLIETENCCRRAIEFKPNYFEAHNNLGVTLYELGRPNEAEACYRRAIEINPDYPEAHNNLGNTLLYLGRLVEAEASYRRAIEVKPEFVDAYSNLGSVLMEIGKIEEAKNLLNKAIEMAPGAARPLVTALLYISFPQDDPRLKQLEAVYAKRESLLLEERIRLDFAMGKAMENIGQYDRSFSAYEEGNRLHRQGHPFDETEDDRFIEKTCRFLTASLFKECDALENLLPPIQDERVPIFIVGMLRSGTTLIEQTLASHPAVYGAGELTTLDELAKKAKLLTFDFTDWEEALLALRKLGQEYLDQIWKHAPDARYITDKMPGNYVHLGLIHLMLPNAKIIHALRNPMDTCFSCYAIRFTLGHEYSYDLGTLGRQYLRYSKLMKHWHNVLPLGRILDVRYEDNISDHEREARRMLDYLGLPWDPSCLKFHESERPVRTASVAQVRKPIYSSSVARWKNFEKHLSPLLETIFENNEELLPKLVQLNAPT
jgi:Tfp pilus assembly protein PilF